MFYICNEIIHNYLTTTLPAGLPPLTVAYRAGHSLSTSMNNNRPESTRIDSHDCFLMADRYIDRFEGRTHSHHSLLLIFVSNATGAVRTTDGASEPIGDHDLVLLGEQVSFRYSQADCRSQHIRQIAIHFSADMFGSAFMDKRLMRPIRDLLNRSHHRAIHFSPLTVMRVFSHIDSIASLTDDFRRLTAFMTILHELAADGEARFIEHTEAETASEPACRRVDKVKSYVEDHFKSDIRLSTLADLAGMTPTAFSRYFKSATGSSVSDYIIDRRITHAAAMLIRSRLSIAEVCFDCGFNNVSHFNRIFRRKKLCSPKEFRERYREQHLTV